jgi:hypothetical protein
MKKERRLLYWLETTLLCPAKKDHNIELTLLVGNSTMSSDLNHHEDPSNFQSRQNAQEE